MRALITIFLLSVTWYASAQPFSLLLGTGLASVTNSESGGTSQTNAIAPTFSPNGGLLAGGSTNVTITSDGNMVYWTTNGNTPDTNLTGYASGTSFTISTTNNPLKAIAWTNDGYRLPSSVASATFTNAPAGWTYYSAVFDGAADSLSKASDLTGVSRVKTGSLSCWYKSAQNFHVDYLLHSVGGYFEISRDGSDLLQVTGYTPAAAVALRLTASAQIDNDGNWHHILISWDLAQSGKSWIYIDGVDRTTRTTHTDNALELTPGGWAVGGNYSGSAFLKGSLAEFYFSTNYFDLSVSGNRDKFYNSSTAKPVDLGSDGSTPAGRQPAIYFHNQVPNWDQNLGGGGAFTENSALGDGGADKP